MPGTVLDASVDASSLSITVEDPGHAHIDSAGSTVLRDGKYSLGHIYSSVFGSSARLVCVD